MLIELHDQHGRLVAIRADSVAHVEIVNDVGCNVYLDYRDPPICLAVRERLNDVVNAVNEALYAYEDSND